MTDVGKYIYGIIIFGFFTSCRGQFETDIMKTEKTKNYNCEVETGACVLTDERNIQEIKLIEQEKVKLIYYTDPICSACWAIEPVLKKFKLAYGDFVDIEYKMGGLLSGWGGFADKSNGISKPSDVAHHWDEVGAETGMSIDGDIWINDPLSSSYPPSIAFKAMEKQGIELSVIFLRKVREMVFLNGENITHEDVLLKAVLECNGDTSQFLSDYHNEAVKQHFYAEIEEGRKMGVRGFPTFIFIGKSGTGFKISGMSGYENYVLALEKALEQKIEAKPIVFSEYDLLKKDQYLATKEISFILSQDEETTLLKLRSLVKEGLIKEEKQKYCSFWRFIED